MLFRGEGAFIAGTASDSHCSDALVYGAPGGQEAGAKICFVLTLELLHFLKFSSVTHGAPDPVTN